MSDTPAGPDGRAAVTERPPVPKESRLWSSTPRRSPGSVAGWLIRCWRPTGERPDWCC